MGRRDRVVAAATAAVVLIVSWTLTIAGGTLDVPRTDDWGFARVAFNLHRTGHIHLIYWGPMTLVGHLMWAQPFLAILGDHRWVLALSTSVLVFAGLAAVYLLARRLLSVGRSLLVVGVLCAFPGVVRDASTYMTDPPALAMQLVTLGCGAAALAGTGRRRVLWLAAALAAGLWAFSIRELAVAAPVAVMFASFTLAPGRRARVRVALGGAVFAVAALLLWEWHRRLPGVEQYRGRPPLATSALAVVTAALTTAAALAPALAVSIPRWWHARHRIGRALGGLAGVAVVAGGPLLSRHLHQHHWWLVGDYLQSDGINGGKLLLGERPIVLGTVVWHVVLALAIISTVVCGALLGEAIAVRVRARGVERPATHPVSRLVACHVVACAGVLVVAAVWNGALYDRYLWPLVASSSLLIVARPSPPTPPTRWHAPVTQIVGSVVFVLVAGCTLLLTLNSAAFDAARWQAATQEVADGVPADEIDGGLEWAGAHSTVPDSGAPAVVDDPLVSWWTGLTGMPHVCSVVTASPIESSIGTPVRRVHWRPMLWWGDATLVVYRLRGPACPDATP